MRGLTLPVRTGQSIRQNPVLISDNPHSVSDPRRNAMLDEVSLQIYSTDMV